MMSDEMGLLLAAYIRKLNHPSETDTEIAQGVKLDLAKIIREKAAHDLSEGRVAPGLEADHSRIAEDRAKGYERSAGTGGQ